MWVVLTLAKIGAKTLPIRPQVEQMPIAMLLIDVGNNSTVKEKIVDIPMEINIVPIIAKTTRTISYSEYNKIHKYKR